ncbi:hypothetical protein Tco_0214471 [Tanacetum coccineum]
MDDEPMWDADHVVTPTPGSAITIPETATKFAIKGTNISKITRKQSKTSKHGHENQKNTKEAKDSKPKPEKSSLRTKLAYFQKPFITRKGEKKERDEK